MGTTRISWLKKVSDGFLFREDFENRYFVDNDVWQTLQGIPEISDVRSVAGTFSLDMGTASNDNAGRPVVIRKAIAISPVLTSDWLITAWFYDTMDTALEGPYLKAVTSDGKYYQVGVRNAVSTTKYSCNQDATTTEDTFKASTASRSAAWKKFQIYLNLAQTRVDIIIDNTVVQSITYASIGSLVHVYIQGGILTNVTNSFGYFDELRVQHSAGIKFYGLNGRSLCLTAGVVSAVTSEQYTTDAAETPTPSLYDVQISKLENAKALDLYWPSQELNGGDVYYFNSIDFGRKAYPVNYGPKNIGTRSTSLYGKTETITTGYLGRLSFTLQALDGEQWRQAETLLFDWLRQGNPVSVQIDSDKSCMSKITTTYPKAGTSTISVQSVLGESDAGITAGDYILEAADRVNRQVLTVATNTSGTLALSTPLNNNFTASDFLRHVLFFPMMILDPNTSQLSYAEPRTARYNWPFQFVEYVQ